MLRQILKKNRLKTEDIYSKKRKDTKSQRKQPENSHQHYQELLEIQVCEKCFNHSQLEHDQRQYSLKYLQITQKVSALFKNIKVIKNQQLANQFSTPRLGSFEIKYRQICIFSKLISGNFPNHSNIIECIILLNKFTSSQLNQILLRSDSENICKYFTKPNSKNVYPMLQTLSQTKNQKSYNKSNLLAISKPKFKIKKIHNSEFRQKQQSSISRTKDNYQQISKIIKDQENCQKLLKRKIIQQSYKIQVIPNIQGNQKRPTYTNIGTTKSFLRKSFIDNNMTFQKFQVTKQIQKQIQYTYLNRQLDLTISSQGDEIKIIKLQQLSNNSSSKVSFWDKNQEKSENNLFEEKPNSEKKKGRFCRRTSTCDFFNINQNHQRSNTSHYSFENILAFQSKKKLEMNEKDRINQVKTNKTIEVQRNQLQKQNNIEQELVKKLQYFTGIKKQLSCVHEACEGEQLQILNVNSYRNNYQINDSQIILQNNNEDQYQQN